MFKENVDSSQAICRLQVKSIYHQLYHQDRSRATEASLADGGGSGPARYQRIGAVGRAAGAVEARETHRKLKFVLLGPGGVGKSTLALKFAAGKVERGGGWLLLVFRISASTMEQDYAGLLDDMLGKGAVRAPSYAAEEGG